MLEAPVPTKPLWRPVMVSAVTSLLAIALLALMQVRETDDMFCVTSRMFGKTYKSCLTGDVLRDTIRKSPAWDQETESPPVSPKKAIKLAEKMRKSVLKAPDDWEWHTMDLHLFLLGDDCVWHVTFQAMPIEREAGLISPHEEITLIVLMDGTVIKPVVVDEEPDENISD
jgi:hypothetical protein